MPKYTVDLVRYVEMAGKITVDADSMEDAGKRAVKLVHEDVRRIAWYDTDLDQFEYDWVEEVE